MRRRVVAQKVLPGQPLDGTGVVCIHLLVRDETSRFVEPLGLHPVIGEDGKPVKQKLESRPTRMRLACDRNKDFHPRVVNGVTHITHRTEEARVVNCPKCKATKEYAEAIGR